MKLGIKDISNIYLGSKEISKVYLGSKEIFSSEIAPNGSPSELVATVLSDTSIKCDWTNGATNQDGTKIYYCLTENGTYTLGNTIIGSGTTGNLTGLTAGILYYIKVVHYKGNKLSEYSNTVHGFTLPDLNKFLFIGYYSQISGGHMPNILDSGDTYITVSGSVGSETYQCPNNASYINADEDNIWFDASDTIRVVLTNELIRYDFTKTFIYYNSLSPYQINSIAILKSGVSLSESEYNSIRENYKLSIWWDNTLSEYGELKGNRNSSKSDWSAVDSDAAALIARMTGGVPSAPLSALIDKTFKDLKNYDIYPYLLQFTKANIHNETDAKLNWIGNTFPIVPVGKPTFTAKKGWLCVTNKYLKSGFIPRTQITAGTIGESNCGFLIDKIESQGLTGTYSLHGAFATAAQGGSAKRFQLETYNTIDKKSISVLNDSGTGGFDKNDDVAAANGIFYAERGDLNHCIGYYNGIKSSQYNVISSSPLCDQELFYGAIHLGNDTAGYYSKDYIATIVICKYLGEYKALALSNIIKYFNDNVGSTF